MHLHGLQRFHLIAGSLLHTLQIVAQVILFQTRVLLQIFLDFSLFLIPSLSQLGLVFRFKFLEFGLFQQTVDFHVEIDRILAELILAVGVNHLLEELRAVKDERRAVAHMHRTECGVHVTLVEGVHHHLLRHHRNEQRVAGSQRHQKTHIVASFRLVGGIMDVAVKLVVVSGFVLLETFVLAARAQGENHGRSQSDQHDFRDVSFHFSRFLILLSINLFRLPVICLSPAGAQSHTPQG